MRGAVADADFAQPIIGSKLPNTGANIKFSPDGQAKYTSLVGRDIKTPADLTKALINKEVSPSQIAIEYVNLNVSAPLSLTFTHKY